MVTTALHIGLDICGGLSRIFFDAEDANVRYPERDSDVLGVCGYFKPMMGLVSIYCPHYTKHL